jgi:putative hemolysin
MPKSDELIKQIDIAKIIDESNSQLLKKLPRFVVKWIAKIIRQDEMNRILCKYPDCVGVDFLTKMIEEFNLKFDIEGKENLPENGKCFFVANHPLGVIDGLVLGFTVYEKYGSFKAIANEAFLFLPQVHQFIAAVNVFKGSSREYIKALDDTYNLEISITHFPAGEVSRLYNGKVQDSSWQKSFITKAISSKRDIVPFYFYDRNSSLFYVVYMIRQLFRIKINLELVLLPREMFKKKNKTIRVVIGKPISYQMFDESLSHWDWAQKVRSNVYELGNNKSKNDF